MRGGVREEEVSRGVMRGGVREEEVLRGAMRGRVREEDKVFSGGDNSDPSSLTFISLPTYSSNSQ